MITQYPQQRKESNKEIEAKNQEYGKIILSYNQGDLEYKKVHEPEFKRARWELTELNLKFVSHLIKKFRGFLDYELLSSGMDALYEKSKDWDYRIASIGAFSGHLVKRKIIDEFYEPRKKRIFSLNDRKPSTNPQDYPLQNLINEENERLKKRKIKDIMAVINNGVLSEMEKYVMREHYIAGRQLTDIAEEYKLTRERISQHHRKAIRKIQSALKPRYHEMKVKQKPIIKKKRKKSISQS